MLASAPPPAAAFALFAWLLSAVEAAAVGAGASATVSDLMGQAGVLAARLGGDIAGWAVDGYQRRPAIMIGLAIVLVLPTLALIGRAFLGGGAGAPHGALGGVGAILVPRCAFVQIEGPRPVRATIDRDVVQIGRDVDNDICLTDSTVHRYHALIERQPDAGFFITDVSGPAGNGVRINGKRRAKACLANGDLVEIGKARLRFEMGL